MRNYFILNGVDSRDFGVYISGQGTFDAPQKSYTFYNVPGRDGALLSSDNRLENATLTYEAFIYKDFNENVANFRTFLLSLNGYTKLTDSYHPDEFRYAVYTGPFEPKVQSKNDAGSFKITFSCKPQRYLLSGEAWADIGAGSPEIRGHSIQVDGSLINDSTVYMYFEHPLESGTPTSPTSFIGETSTGFSINGTSAYSSDIDFLDPDTLTPVRSGVSVLGGNINLLNGDGSSLTTCEKLTTLLTWNYSGGYFTQLAPSGVTDIVACTHYTPSSNSADGTIQIDSGYYKIKDSRFTGALAQTQFNAWLSSHDVYVALSEYVVMEADAYTPTFPASGAVNILTDSPYQELEIGYYPTGTFSNPTYMKSRPLIKVDFDVDTSETVSFTINNDTVTITSPDDQRHIIMIDCEMQDCYEGSTNRNSIVSFAPTYDFPVLNPGENVITVSTTAITDLEIKPRWWRV